MSPARRPPPPPEVLHEDNHLLALNKPAMLPTMGAPGGVETLLTVAKAYIKEKHQKPGNVYLGVVSRLDAPVTGVVLFARTSKAARRLTEQFRAGSVEKTYWALVESLIEPAEGELAHWIAPDKRHRRVRIAGAGLPGAKEARLRYRRVAFRRGFSLLEIGLITGRKHQIRVQLADHGYPIVGDRKYGSPAPFPLGIALHARRLLVAHPVGGHSVELIAPPPGYWPLAENHFAG